MLRPLLSLLIVWCLAASARAEKAFVMAPSVETERITQDVQTRVLRAVTDSMRSQGFSVVTLEDAKQRNVACASHDCVPEALDKLHADIGVQVTMMASPTMGGGLGSVGVAFHQRELVYGGDSVRILDNGIERAIDDAIRAARNAQERGPGPWLIVTGTPPAAELYLDDKRVDDGDLPCEIRVPPSATLKLTVKLSGYQSRDYTITSSFNPATATKLPVSLAPLAEGAYEPRDDGATPKVPNYAATTNKAERARRPHAADYVVGGSLMAGGLALALVNPLRSAASKGDCFNDSCSETVRPMAGPTTGYVLGGAALIGVGAMWTWWWKPFSFWLDANNKQAVIGAQGRF
jgi:hypothetical protein